MVGILAALSCASPQSATALGGRDQAEATQSRDKVAPTQGHDEAAAAHDDLLPPSSRHRFLMIDPSWSVKTEYMEKAAEESFMMADPPAPGSKLKLFKQLSYHLADKPNDPTGFVKLQRFNQDGTRTMEIDQIGGDHFERELYPDGSIAAYAHWRQGKGVVAGYSLDVRGKVIGRVHDGTGEQVSWIYGPDDYTRSYLDHGVYYLLRSYLARTAYSISFCSPGGDNLRITPTEERLTLASHREFWTLPVRGRAYGQVWPDTMEGMNPRQIQGAGQPVSKPDAIHDRLLTQDRLVRNPRPKDLENLANQLGRDYETRRKEFVGEYRRHLDSIGHKDLGELIVRAKSSALP